MPVQQEQMVTGKWQLPCQTEHLADIISEVLCLKEYLLLLLWWLIVFLICTRVDTQEFVCNNILKNKILESEFNLVRMKESEFRNQGLGIRTKGQDQGSRIGQGLGSLCTFVECQETLFPHAGILACLPCRPHCVRRPVGERAFLMRSSIILLN